MLHAIVFDFDGVLANSEPLHFEVFRQVLAELGITLTPRRLLREVSRLRRSRRVPGGAARSRPAGRRGDDRLADRAKADRFPRLVDGRDVLFPGAAAACAASRAEVPLAIASGALPHEIELILAGARLRDAFHVVVGAGDTPRSKPAPDPYARAVELLQERGLVPAGPDAASRCVAIEDSHWGIQSAKAAGLSCIAVTTSYEAGELGAADLVVPAVDALSLQQVAALVARG